MEFYEALRTRRSVRSYRPDPVPQDALDRVLEAARISPSGSNRQPWRFILVTDPGLRGELAAACGDQEFVGEAPTVVVAYGHDIRYNRGGYMGEMSFILDASIAFTHLVLAARAEGLGTCWIGSFENGKVKELLGIPDDHDVVAVSPLGYPEGEWFEETDRRKPLAEIISMNTF
ncbi:MAG: nitroreductase family protein [Candidatus Bathyarchaeota archaeon]|nr:nitroreductase family protein [Candidatus Bathyarchaeota archaeon]